MSNIILGNNNTKFKVGGNDCSIYLGTTLLYSGGTQPLPYDAELTHLESDGTQYINTNAHINTSDFELGYTFVGNQAQWGYVHQNVANGAWLMVAADNAYCGTYTKTVGISSYLAEGVNTVIMTQNSITVNGNTRPCIISLSGVDNVDSVPLYLFVWYDFYRNGVQYQSNSKIKSFYLKNNGVLVFDMIPVRVGQVGYMYDKVSGQLFGNAGTGSFILGRDASILPSGYTEVEYIGNSGTSVSSCAYLNTGLQLYDTVGNSFNISGRVKSEFYNASGYDALETVINNEGVASPYNGFTYRYAYNTHTLEFTCNPSGEASFSSTANSDGTNSIVINCTGTTVTDQVPLAFFASYNGNYNTPYRFAKAKIYSMTIQKNGVTVMDYVPAKRDNDSVYGLYDLITETFYTSSSSNGFIGGDPI